MMGTRKRQKHAKLANRVDRPKLLLDRAEMHLPSMRMNWVTFGYVQDNRGELQRDTVRAVSLFYVHQQGTIYIRITYGVFYLFAI